LRSGWCGSTPAPRASRAACRRSSTVVTSWPATSHWGRSVLRAEDQRSAHQPRRAGRQVQGIQVRLVSSKPGASTIRQARRRSRLIEHCSPPGTRRLPFDSRSRWPREHTAPARSVLARRHATRPVLDVRPEADRHP
jgi:hypothetical protein